MQTTQERDGTLLGQGVGDDSLRDQCRANVRFFLQDTILKAQSSQRLSLFLEPLLRPVRTAGGRHGRQPAEERVSSQHATERSRHQEPGLHLGAEGRAKHVEQEAEHRLQRHFLVMLQEKRAKVRESGEEERCAETLCVLIDEAALSRWATKKKSSTKAEVKRQAKHMERETR